MRPNILILLITSLFTFNVLADEAVVVEEELPLVIIDEPVDDSFLGEGGEDIVIENIDPGKVNKVVAEILKEMTANDEFIDKLEIVLDEGKTDVSKPSIGVSIEAATRQAAWSVETTSIKAALELDTFPTEEEGMVLVDGTFTGTLNTDVYSLAKFVAEKDLCEDLTFDPINDSKACEILEEEILSAESFQEQVEAVEKAFDAFKVELEVYIAKLEEKLEIETDEKEKLSIGYSIDNAKETLEVFESVEFITDDSGIMVEADLSDEPFLSGLNLSITLQISQDTIELAISGNYTADENQMKSYYSLPVEYIRALESNTEQSRATVKAIAGFFVDALKDIVTDGNEQ